MSASPPGSDDRAQEGGDPAVVAAQLEDLLDHGAVLALEVAGPLAGRRAVADLLDLDQQIAARVRAGDAGDAAVKAGQGDGVDAAGEAAGVDDLGDRADASVVAFRARDHEDTLGITDGGGDCRAHAREENRVVEWDQEKLHFECPRLTD